MKKDKQLFELFSEKELKRVFKKHPNQKLVEKFIKYCRSNPEVYEKFLMFSLAARRKMSKYGAKSIFEQIRWHYQVESNYPDFKVNNAYTSFYARLVIHVFPAMFEGFFELRKSPKKAA